MVLPVILFALLSGFRLALGFFYYLILKGNQDRMLWVYLALFWGIWSVPFWFISVFMDMKDLEKDVMRFKILRFIFDRTSLLNTLGLYLLAQFISVFAVMPFILIIMLTFYGTIDFDHFMRPWIVLPFVLYLNATVIVLIYMWAIRPGHIDIKGLGLQKGNALKMVLIGFGLGIVLIGMAAVGEYFVAPYLPTDAPAFLNADQEIFKTKSVLDYILLLIGAGLIAPVGEELFFRGYMFSLVKKKDGIYFALLASSLVFAAWHLSIILFPIIVAAALIICFVRWKSDSIIPCIVIHMMNNVVAVSIFYWLS